jgi:hypothetical protein
LVVGFSLWGCDTDPYDIPQFTEFKVQVDSIEFPSSIFLGQKLDIKFYATLGTDGCYTFSRFDAQSNGNTLDITVYGKHEVRDICNDAISYLYGAILEVNRMDTGMYIIHVSQPLPPDIYDTVYVKPVSIPKTSK